MATAVDTAEFESFMSKVNLVSSTISGLKDGSVSVDHSERVLAKLQPPSPPRPLEESKEQLSAPPSFRPGPGVVDDYSHYCARCRIEHLAVSASTCSQCNGPLTTRAERQDALKQRVKRLHEEKTARRERRQRFQALKETRKQQRSAQILTPSSSSSTGASTSSSSSSSSSAPLPSAAPLPSTAWDDFEPSSSSEDDDPSNPAFTALASDISARTAKRQRDKASADNFKALGNAAYASGDLPVAVAHYASAIALCRSDKTYYANRAAAYLRLQQWEEAVKDCGLVLDVWEFIDRGDERRKERGPRGLRTPDEVTVLKALVRRAEALRALHQHQRARDDLTRALAMEPEGKRRAEILIFLKQLTQHEAEQQQQQHEREREAPETGAIADFVAAVVGEGPVGAATMREARAVLERDEEARVALHSTGGLAAVIARIRKGAEVEGMMAVLVAALLSDKNKDALAHDGLDAVVALVRKPIDAVGSLACAAVALVTESEAARCALRSTQPPALDTVIAVVEPSTPASLLVDALTALGNLAYAAAWKAATRDRGQQLVPALVGVLKRKELPLLSAALSLLGNVFTQGSSHVWLKSYPELPSAISTATARAFAGKGAEGQRCQCAALATLLNLSTTPSAFASMMETAVKPSADAMLQTLSSAASSSDASSDVLTSRLLALLAKAAVDDEWQRRLVEAGAVQSAVHVLERGVRRGDHQRARGDAEDDAANGNAVTLMENAVKLFAACSHQPTFPTLVGPHCPLLPALLSSPSPFLAGNAALVVSSLALTPSVLPSLRPCVPLLMRVMREWSGRDGKGQANAASNAAVACARLAKDGRNVDVIRANGGMALLASAGKRVLH